MERNWVVIMEGEEKGWEAVQWLSEFEGASPPLSSVACANEPRLRKTSTRGSFAVRQVSAQQQTRKSACAEGGRQKLYLKYRYYLTRPRKATQTNTATERTLHREKR